MSIIGLVLAVGIVTSLSKHTIDEPVKIQSTITGADIRKAAEVAATPVVTITDTVDTDISSTTVVETPIVIKSSDDYITEYFSGTKFWVDGMREEFIYDIKQIITSQPEKFTDSGIDNSFIYLKQYFMRPVNSNPDIALNGFHW
jgi:hypothetical protein